MSDNPDRTITLAETEARDLRFALMTPLSEHADDCLADTLAYDKDLDDCDCGRREALALAPVLDAKLDALPPRAEVRS